MASSSFSRVVHTMKLSSVLKTVLQALVFMQVVLALNAAPAHLDDDFYLADFHHHDGKKHEESFHAPRKSHDDDDDFWHSHHHEFPKSKHFEDHERPHSTRHSIDVGRVVVVKPKRHQTHHHFHEEQDFKKHDEFPEVHHSKSYNLDDDFFMHHDDHHFDSSKIIEEVSVKHKPVKSSSTNEKEQFHFPQTGTSEDRLLSEDEDCLPEQQPAEEKTSHVATNSFQNNPMDMDPPFRDRHRPLLGDESKRDKDVVFIEAKSDDDPLEMLLRAMGFGSDEPGDKRTDTSSSKTSTESAEVRDSRGNRNTDSKTEVFS